jgi:hypothetical protein
MEMISMWHELALQLAHTLRHNCQDDVRPPEDGPVPCQYQVWYTASVAF